MRTREFSASRRSRRKGTILVLSVFLFVVVIGVVALSIDIGYLLLARAELQRSADAAALAGAWELIDSDALVGGGSNVEANARTKAAQYAALNPVLKQNPTVNNADVVVGYLADYSDPNATIDTSGTFAPNTVQVKVPRISGQNGRVPFFLASILGVDDAAAQAESTAVLAGNFRGFRTPSGGGNLGMLPFALDVDTWNDHLGGVGTDDWKWNDSLGEVQSGADGVLEMNLFPQGTGSPGNRGTVDIGSNNNSTADIARQILDGISPADLAHHGGSLELDANGELFLNGDTGISAGVKDELESIRGEPRIIPIFLQVTGPGNNAQYTIIQFTGIRIMEVKLTGSMSSKRIMIQPALVVSEGGIPSTSTTTTHYVYSPAWIAR